MDHDRLRVGVFGDAEGAARFDQAGGYVIGGGEGQLAHCAERVLRTQGFCGEAGGIGAAVGAGQHQDGEF
ncbi:hypothetical protein FQZ97_622900 [compost metagenome]